MKASEEREKAILNARLLISLEAPIKDYLAFD
jgi:hypothetical protein